MNERKEVILHSIAFVIGMLMFMMLNSIMGRLDHSDLGYFERLFFIYLYACSTLGPNFIVILIKDQQRYSDLYSENEKSKAIIREIVKTNPMLKSVVKKLKNEDDIDF